MSPFEAFTLCVDSFQGKIPCFVSQLEGGQVAPLLISHALQHLQLNGQAMAVPARYVLCTLALQQLELQDEVFQDLV